MLTQDGPLIVQTDFHVLLDARHPHAEHYQSMLARFADLVKRPGDLHTYRITSLSIWNALASGMTAGEILSFLVSGSRYDVPGGVLDALELLAWRYGKIHLERKDGEVQLVCQERQLADKLESDPCVRENTCKMEDGRWQLKPGKRGLIKRELLRSGYPVLDLAGYDTGEELKMELLPQSRSGRPFQLRDYQAEAVDLFHREGDVYGGSGVLVLPCGAGKTVIGIAALARLSCAALILTSSMTSVRQWRNELLDKTSLTPDDIGEYAGRVREVKPVTIATYQMVTHRHPGTGEYSHMRLFDERDWGLVIYDEVHSLPAPVFRRTADIQATRRLGLTATLVREDGREEDVFSLIGPKRYDLPWKKLEEQGHIAAVTCTEIRVALEGVNRDRYHAAAPRDRNRLAAENPAKQAAVRELLERHPGRPALVVGQYLKQLGELADMLGAPLLTGQTPQAERMRLYESFKQGEIPVLVVSKIANFAVDLPDAAVAIQVSGSFGSRQEEAQRIGRLLRPKHGDNTAWFYTLVTADTKETEYARKRQLFLAGQGYTYLIAEQAGKLEDQGRKDVSGS
ncbi:DNA repair helicase XPB [Paenibacillus tarimensis]|uniref:DNA repair helicase XPB n=1 Tax=Paenibacillus tarimensis TaxID=416012 RepID=UPI001F2860B3|nr:DNA repair helicase XPB [Paenibacillus tarimensis]MCF2942205.1 DEAD/DEAH box helicase [Paenibacillus tarimensis]